MESHPPQDIETSLLIDDAAARLGVSRRTVYYRIREGRLATIRTRCGSQRVLCSSIDLLRRATEAAAARRRQPRGTSVIVGSDAEALSFQIQPFS